MITPEDIKNQQFEVSFKGYKTREVDDFLDVVHADLEELYEEIEALRRRVAASELLVEEAKNHEDEFIASMQDDKAKSEAALAAAKAEGERIIREAKNAAAGIMAEVRRRAGDISSESRKASADIIDEAKAEAERILAEAAAEAEAAVTEARSMADAITDDAKAEADKKLFSARTEAENTVRAAKAEADAILSEAVSAAEELTSSAAESAAVHEEYIKEVRAAAEKLCFELDAELKNSASRIALLGRKISATDIPDTAPVTAEPVIPAMHTASVQPAAEEEPEDIPAHAGQVYAEEAETYEDDVAEEEFSLPEDNSGDEAGPHGGYFSHEYRLAMTELFGEDAEGAVPPVMDEDDDTYDYLDHADYSMGGSDDDTYGSEDDDEGGDGDAVTSEYSGIPGGRAGTDLHDIFTDDALERVFRSPTQEDIDDILNG